jgi:hypothetical protein
MPPRRVAARGNVRAKRGSVSALSPQKKQGIDDEDDYFADQEDTVSYWVKFKLWVAKHEHKWGAIFYSIFLLIFSLVVLKSQVTFSASDVTII